MDVQVKKRKLSKETEFVFNHNPKPCKQRTGLNSSLVSESTDENSMYSCELKFFNNEVKVDDISKNISLMYPKIYHQSFLATYMHFSYLEYVLFGLNLSFYFMTTDR